MSYSLTVPTTEQTRKRSPARLAYMPGLDGLRAVAVIAVLFYHADLAWFRGGYLGVDVFFVLSGFLITSLLIAEWHRDGKIDLKAFWLRRARRLLPALFLMLVASLTFAVLFMPDEVASLRNDAIAAATYVTNWYLVLTQRSYFETVGRPSLFQHLWSLAVEEQFYMLWPVLFIFIVKFLHRWALPLVILGATASATYMWLAFDPDADPSRLYYGTDARAAALLIGVGLAFGLTDIRTKRLRSRVSSLALDIAGFGALTLVTLCFIFMDETQEVVYRGGMLILELASALLVLSLVLPQAQLTPWLLGGRVLRWVGQRSYGIYLWHWPVYMVTRPQLDLPLDGLPLIFLRFAATVGLAELSYRFVELPVRNGALSRAWSELRPNKRAANGTPKLRLVGITTALLGFAILIGVPVVQARPPALPDYLAVQEINTLNAPDMGSNVDGQTPAQPTPTVVSSARAVAPAVLANSGLPSPPESHESSAEQPGAPKMAVQVPAGVESLPALSQASHPPDAPTTVPTPPRPQPKNEVQSASVTPFIVPTKPAATQTAQANNIASLGKITAIGDSVMIGAARNLKQLGDVDIDAQVGRQASAAIKILRQYHDSGRLSPVVLLHIGNNGTFSAKQFDEIMKALSDEKYVVFVNLKVPRSWEWPNNKVIMDGVARYPNGVMVDWRAASIDEPQLFWKDGIHLRPEGAKLYAGLIADTLSALARK